MKKFSILIGVVLFSILIAGCGKTETTAFDSAKKIDVVSREAGSGTRGAFEEIVGFNIDTNKDGVVENPMKTGVVIRDGNGVVSTYVLDNIYSIGYVSYTQLAEHPELKALKVNNIDAEVENVLNKTYALARPFNMMYADANLNSAEQGFVLYLASTEGLSQIENAGGITDRAGSTAFDTSKCAAGNLVLGGSTSVEPAAKAAAVDYSAVCASKGYTVSYTYDATGSGTGITKAKSGDYHIGFASRDLTSTEKEGLTVKVIAMDGIAMVVNKYNPLTNLTLDDIKKLYTGTYSAWSDIIK